MRGLLRLFVVGFSVLSLLVVAAVGVSASAGKSASSETLKNSVVAAFSGHLDKGVFNTVTQIVKNVDKDRDRGNHNECKTPHHKHHTHATHDRENSKCDGGDDSGSD